MASKSAWMVLARLKTEGSKNAVFSDYELSGPAQRPRTGGTEYIKGGARYAEWNQGLAQDRYSNRPGSYDNANMEKESRDAYFGLAKAFSSSSQDITDELLVSLSESMFHALHEPGDSSYQYIEIGVFRTGNRETPGEDHPDLHKYPVDTNLQTMRHITMTIVTKKKGDFAIKMKVDSSVVDGKNISLGGAKKPLNVKLGQSKSTADTKQVSLGGAKKPLNVKLGQSKSTADTKQVSLGGAKKPLNIKLGQSKSTADTKQVSLGGAKKPLNVKLDQSKSTADKKQVRIGGGRAPLRQ